ncbi:hypothetical protein D3C79_961910 [compost metagenome]
MKIAVQQMVGKEAQKILLRLPQLTGRKGQSPLPEINQYRSAVLRMHKITEADGPGILFPGKKAVVQQEIRPLAAQMVQLRTVFPLRQKREITAEFVRQLLPILQMHPNVRHSFHPS